MNTQHKVLTSIFFLGSIFLLCLTMLPTATAVGASATSIINVSLLNQDPDPAQVGDIVELRMSVENNGGIDANGLIVEIVPSYPFEYVSSNDDIVFSVGTLQGYQSGENAVILKPQIKINKDATAGVYDLEVIYYYEDGKTYVTQTVPVEITNKESAEVVHIDKSVIIPGQQDNLTFTITNVGGSALEDMSFYWESEDDVLLPVKSDNTKHIKYLGIDEQVSFTYNVIADTNVDPGLYQLNMYLTYDSESDTEAIETKAGVYIGGSTDFDVAYSQSSDDEISFSIANIGSNPAYSVSVKIPQQDGWSVSGSRSQIIGNLNTGDYTVATFILTQSMAQPTGMPGESDQGVQVTDSNSVLVDVVYTDTMGNRITVEKEVSMGDDSSSNSTMGQMMGGDFPGGMGNRSSTSSAYYWYAALGVVVVVVLVVFMKYRRHRILSPKSTFFGWILGKEKRK